MGKKQTQSEVQKITDCLRTRLQKELEVFEKSLTKEKKKKLIEMAHQIFTYKILENLANEFFIYFPNCFGEVSYSYHGFDNNELIEKMDKITLKSMYKLIYASDWHLGNYQEEFRAFLEFYLEKLDQEL